VRRITNGEATFVITNSDSTLLALDAVRFRRE
jgi:hypothetical protein